jgi:NADH-quinone oxidoreductase subunit M
MNMNLDMLASVAGDSVLLPMLVVVPIVGAVVVALLKDELLSRAAALGTAVATLALAIAAGAKVLGGQTLSYVSTDLFRLDLPSSGNSVGVSFGLDSISLWMILLAAVLVPAAMIASFAQIRDRANAYYAWMLVLLGSVVGVFLSRDVILFYAFFELTLIPSFFLIGQWGGPDRRAAAIKFFVFTFVGSVFMLVSLLIAGFNAGTFDVAGIARWVQTDATPRQAFWVGLGVLVGLAVKVPLLPLHTWQPLAYTQAPAAVTALLSGVLAKLGTYGLLRLAMPFALVDAGGFEANFIYVLAAMSTIAVVYAGLCAWMQTDAKTLVAYSSISHLGLCVLAMLSFNTIGLQASVLYMVNHGISTAAIFLMLGMIEARFGTRHFDKLSGIGRQRPWLAGLFVFFVMSSIGLPLTNGFVSEFLSILAAGRADHLVLTLPLYFWNPTIPMWLIVATTIVLGAIYMLHLTARFIFGPARQPLEVAGDRPDLSGRELAALLPLAALVLFLGVRPQPVLDSVAGPAVALSRPVEQTTTRIDSNATQVESNSMLPN